MITSTCALAYEERQRHQQQQQSQQDNRQGNPSLVLVDVACGRGGDVSKWARTPNLACVIGVDHSEVSIDEAKRRARDQRVCAHFIHMTLLGDASVRTSGGRPVPLVDESAWAQMHAPARPPPPLHSKNDPVQIDVATCMFALQYFCKDEATLDAVFATLAEHVRVGGYISGCVPDGRRVYQRLMGPGGDSTSRVSEDGVVHLCRQWDAIATTHYVPSSSRGTDTVTPTSAAQTAPHKQQLGMAYTCAIQDTVTEGVSSEFLVWPSIVTRIAARYGFEPATQTLREYSPALASYTSPPAGAGTGKLFASFLPCYSRADDPLGQLARASRMFSYFALVRVRKTGIGTVSGTCVT